MITQIKHSGDKNYIKVTGTPQELQRIARIYQQPIKPINGFNPEHIDLPIRKGDAMSKTGLRNHFIVSRDDPKHSFWSTAWSILIFLVSASLVGLVLAHWFMQ